jgi:hypothetical protein
LRPKRFVVGLVLAIQRYHVGLGRIGLGLLELLVVFIESLRVRFRELPKEPQLARRLEQWHTHV